MSSKIPLTSSSSASLINETVESAVPTLRVMRLQSPELHQTISGSLLEGHSLLERSLCLPDSLSVYVGETFMAYLGILNASSTLPIRRLTVSAQLQTPSQRWQLPSRLDGNHSRLSSSLSSSSSSGIEIAPQSGTDAIVSHAIEEPGQHILRVEVGYMTTEGGSKHFRKFYRFNVTRPITIRQSTARSGDDCCFVSVDVECNHPMNTNNSNNNNNNSTAVPLVISQATFLPVEGLSALRIGGPNNDPKQQNRSSSSSDNNSNKPPKSALELYDSAGILTPPSGCCRYLFQVKATSKEARLRGIAAGDLLGKAAIRWRKAMGETGQCFSTPVYCPAVEPTFDHDDTTTGRSSATDQLLLSAAAGGGGTGAGNSFVVHRSGLSVDIASLAARRASRPERSALAARLPITVEPIDPPSRIQLGVPHTVQFLVVNHSDRSMSLQLQLRLSQMTTTGLVVCGPSFQSLGEVGSHGGSTVVKVRFLALAAGLVRVSGCTVVDVVTGREIPQPALFHVFVEQPPPPVADDEQPQQRQARLVLRQDPASHSVVAADAPTA